MQIHRQKRSTWSKSLGKIHRGEEQQPSGQMIRRGKQTVGPKRALLVP